jgi:DNA-binding GntR family transcriptional regulator
MSSGLQARLAGRILIHARERGYGPGALLSENALAQTFGVSRTPVRGALAVLSDRGLLNVVPRRGYILKRAVRDQDLEPYADFSSADDKLIQRLAADRCAGILPDNVSETDLMRRYGIARGALARVLNSLAQDNVIQRRSGHGWRFLPALDATQLHEDSYRFRLLIEPACVLEPTFRLDEARAQRLRQLHVALLADGLEKLNSSRFFELNAEFHEFVAGCSRNRFLEQAVTHHNRLRRFFISVPAPVRMRVSCSEHVAILDRLMTGEREHAATLLWRHLLGSSRERPRFQRPAPAKGHRRDLTAAGDAHRPRQARRLAGPQ